LTLAHLSGQVAPGIELARVVAGHDPWSLRASPAAPAPTT
jgi:hypothetical protein